VLGQRAAEQAPAEAMLGGMSSVTLQQGPFRPEGPVYYLLGPNESRIVEIVGSHKLGGTGDTIQIPDFTVRSADGNTQYTATGGHRSMQVTAAGGKRVGRVVAPADRDAVDVLDGTDRMVYSLLRHRPQQGIFRKNLYHITDHLHGDVRDGTVSRVSDTAPYDIAFPSQADPSNRLMICLATLLEDFI
jgi:hypothetical protein